MKKLLPHQLIQLNKKSKINNDITYRELFSLESLNIKLNEIIPKKLSYCDYPSFITFNDLVPKFVISQLEDSVYREYKNTVKFTIPKTVMPFIYNELKAYLQSPLLTDLKKLADAELERMNKDSIDEISRNKQEIKAYLEAIESIKERTLEEFKSINVSSINTYEEFVSENKSFVVKHNQVRDLTRKIEVINEDNRKLTEIIFERISSKSHLCLTENPLEAVSISADICIEHKAIRNALSMINEIETILERWS